MGKESVQDIDDSFMIRTAHPDIYEELCRDRRIFRLDIHLFATALSIGILRKKRSDLRPNHDIVRLGQLTKSEHEEIKSIIRIARYVVHESVQEQDSRDLIINFADGGLEYLWEEYQTQGILDWPRLIDDSKQKWPNRITEILEESTDSPLLNKSDRE
jgi:hypothetical protein